MVRVGALAGFRDWRSGSAANAGDGADGWFLGSDRNFAAQRSEAPAGRAEGSGNLCSDPETPAPEFSLSRFRFRFRAEPVEASR